MIAILAAALLQASAPEPASPAPAEPPPLTPVQQVEALQQVYDHSCADRGFDNYNDLCNVMMDQIRVARRRAAREARRRPVPAPPPAEASLAPKGDVR